MKWMVFLLLLTPPLQATTREERALIRFYGKHYPHLQSEYLSEIVQGTEKYAAKLGLSGQVDTILSMGHRESNFDMFADDGLGKRRSLGFYQTREQYRDRLRAWWLERGVELGDWEDVETQCALGVAEFLQHLHRSDGNVWGAVRRYNGSGPAARRHAQKVFISRRVIFGRAYVEGERIRLKKF